MGKKGRCNRQFYLGVGRGVVVRGSSDFLVTIRCLQIVLTKSRRLVYTKRSHGPVPLPFFSIDYSQQSSRREKQSGIHERIRGPVDYLSCRFESESCASSGVGAPILDVVSYFMTIG